MVRQGYKVSKEEILSLHCLAPIGALGITVSVRSIQDDKSIDDLDEKDDNQDVD